MKILKTTFPITLSPLFKYHLQVSVLILIVSILAFWNRYIYYKQIDSYTPSLVMFSILGIIVPWIAHFIQITFSSIHTIIDELTETNNKEWFLQQFQLAFGINLWSVSISLILSTIAIKTDSILWGNSESRVTTIGLPYFLLLGLLFGMLGNLGWTYFCIIKLASKLKSLRTDDEPFDSKSEEFKRLNSSFLKMFGLGIIIYLVAISTCLKTS